MKIKKISCDHFWSTLIIFCYCVNYSLATGEDSRGKVIKLKSPVTILPPTAREAHELQEGDFVSEGSSIVTKEKSFAIISFSDGHKMTIGPKSKVVLEQLKKNEASVVQLLVGQVRSSIKPSPSSPSTPSSLAKDKFFIHTRTAAMGVRGTEFQVAFNAENKISSLLTISGNVMMGKVNEKRGPKENPKNSVEMVKELKTLVHSEHAVEARVGDYAKTSDTEENIAPPVKISPVQLTLIKMNEEPGEKKLDQKIIEKEVAKTKDEYAKEALTPTGSTTTVKAGGFVDLSTGFYIPPSSNSEYDKKTNTFVSKDENKEMGSVASDGSYKPPQGLKIDAIKGFVAVATVANTVDAKVEAIANKLNNEIQEQIPKNVVRKNRLEENDQDPYKQYYKR